MNKSQSKPAGKSAPKFSIKHGFFKNQLVWFLCTALLPLLIASVFTVRNTQEQLTTNVSEGLAMIADQKARIVEEFFRDNYHSLLFLATEDKIVDMLKDLELFHSMSGFTAGKFVKSPDWEYLTQSYDAEFTPFMAANDIYDLFLISEKGDILYTFAREADLGTNVFNGEFSRTKFSQACVQALDNEYPFFSDFELYSPSGGVVAAFWATPVFDRERNKKGVLAAQIRVDKLNKLMRAGEQGHEDAYLVGTDLLVRASSRFAGSEKSLTMKADSLQATMWLEEVSETDVSFSDSAGHYKALIYRGLGGQDVLGGHHEVEVGQVRLAVITEIPVSQAFSIVSQQRRIAIIIVQAAILLVAVIAFIAAKKVTSPLHKLTALAERVALGDLEIQDARSSSKNEFGQVENSFAKVVISLQEISLICEDIARGIFNRRATVRGEKDVLAQSVNTMIDNFKNVITQANEVAQGNYSHDISPRSEQDEIGLALRRMTENLRTISGINQQNDWLKTGQMQLAEAMSGGKELRTLARDVVGLLARYLDCPVGTFYVENDQEEGFFLAGSYSFRDPESLIPSFRVGEGLIGEAARKKEYLLLKEVPEDCIRVESSLGSVSPRQILAMPLVFENQVKGVFELGALNPFTPLPAILNLNIIH